MSIKHPIIAITGSSGAGTTSVKKTFEQIFRREKINPVYIEGDDIGRCGACRCSISRTPRAL